MVDKNDGLDLIPILVPDIPAPEKLFHWIENIHKSKHYTNFGPLVKKLELEFSRELRTSVNNISTVANATLGLELVLQALNLPKGSRILVPAFTFVATVTAVLRSGHTPVLADVDRESWLLTPEISRFALKRKKIDAVIPVATFGMPQDMDGWTNFEKETGVPVVIDAAAAFGSQKLFNGQGTLVFSLHATKSLPAIEGGIVVSNRPGLVQTVRQLSNFGINLDNEIDVPIGSLINVGTNAKMSELHAAVGLASLESWSGNAERRRNLFNNLKKKMQRVSGDLLVWQKDGAAGQINAPTLFCMRFPNRLVRDLAEKRFHELRISTRRWYLPLLCEMQALVGRCEVLEDENSRILSDTLLGLPFFLDLSPAQINRCIKAIELTFNEYHASSNRLIEPIVVAH